MKRLSAKAFRTIFETTAQAMWIVDLEDLRFLLVNRAACERYGYSADEFSRMTLLDIRTPEDGHRVWDAVREWRRLGTAPPPRVWEHRTKDGRRLFTEVNGSYIKLGSRDAEFVILRDVSHERALEAELNSLFAMSQDIMTVSSLKGKLIASNNAVETILGWNRDEAAQFTAKDMIHKDDLERWQSFSKSALIDGGNHSTELRLRAKNGSYRWIQLGLTFDLPNDRIYTVARDTTETKQQTEQITRMQSNLSWAQQISHLGSWVYEPSTGVFELSDEYYRITGFEPGGYEPTWENIIARVHPDDRDIVELGPRTLKAESWKPERTEVRLVLPDGSIRFVASYFDVKFDVHGNPIMMHGTIHDISEQKERDELRTWLSGIVSSSGEAIIGTSLDGAVVSWNKAAEDLFGYSADEIFGEPVVMLVPPDRWAEAEEILRRLQTGEPIPETETERVDRMGRTFEARFSISPIRTEAGRLVGAAAICSDISARKEAERSVARQLAHLNALRTVDIAISGSRNLEETLNVIVSQALATTGVTSVCLFHYDSKAEVLKLAASANTKHRKMSEEELQMATSIALDCLRDRGMTSFRIPGETIVGMRDLYKDHEVSDARPLIAQNEVVGVLTVHYPPSLDRTSDQTNFLDALADQAAIAVESNITFETLQKSRDELLRAYDETLEGLVSALDLRDKETEGHSRRVTDLTIQLATLIGLSGEELQPIYRGALLHDIGKIGVSDSILLKPGPLTDEEWVQMRRHPVHARNILRQISFLESAVTIPYYHHEKWDGSGYPEGLAGEAIPLAARIFALADVWDALSSDRPYRKAWSYAQVKEHIKSQSGIHFDPEITTIFLNMV